MASEDTPMESKTTVTDELTMETKIVNRSELEDEQKQFLEDCDAIRKKFKLDCMIVSASPPESDHEYVYISDSNNPFYALQTAIRLQEFYLNRDIETFKRSRDRALGILGMLEKVMTNKMGKPQN